MDLDFSFVEKNNHLNKEDFNKLSEAWLKILNPLRVKSIRKYMEFKPIPYKIYVENFKDYSPSSDSEMKDLDATFIPLFFICTFTSSMFPTFQDEYFNPLGNLTNKAYTSMEGLKMLESGNYHSLCYAAYELEKEIHTRFENAEALQNIAEETIILPQFLVPFKVDSEFPMTIALHINMVA
jgi:hypothetical protein